MHLQKTAMEGRLGYSIASNATDTPTESEGDEMSEDRDAKRLEAEARVKELEAVVTDYRRLTREMDMLLNGESGAAPQASLCDIVSQIAAAKDTK